jgi:hypothetical protein
MNRNKQSNGVQGMYGSMASFFIASGKQQIISETDIISVECHHTKVYSKLDPIILQLFNGHQPGQLKKISFIYKGSVDADITILCPCLNENLTRMIMKNAGDYILLMYNGSQWVVLETLNFIEPCMSSPIIC